MLNLVCAWQRNVRQSCDEILLLCRRLQEAGDGQQIRRSMQRFKSGDNTWKAPPDGILQVQREEAAAQQDAGHQPAKRAVNTPISTVVPRPCARHIPAELSSCLLLDQDRALALSNRLGNH